MNAAERAADLAALAGASDPRPTYERLLFKPARYDGRPNPRHLDKDGYRRTRRDARRASRKRTAPRADVGFPDAQTIAPVRISVEVRKRIEVGAPPSRGTRAPRRAGAARRAQASPRSPSRRRLRGPLAYRQGKPMRPDVAQAFDRMAGRRPRTASRW